MLSQKVFMAVGDMLGQFYHYGGNEVVLEIGFYWRVDSGVCEKGGGK